MTDKSILAGIRYIRTNRLLLALISLDLFAVLLGGVTDSLRGRVSAVNWLFIGASSELGEFESGLTAALFGTVAAALLGGLGTLAVVLLWSRIFPELRRTDTASVSGA